MRQSERVKRFQLFLYTTGRMAPPNNLSRVHGYPGETYTKTIYKNGVKHRRSLRKRHLVCSKCDGYGSVYTGIQEPGNFGYETCPTCNGRLYSKKGYRV